MSDHGLGRIYTPDSDDHKYLIPKTLAPEVVTQKLWELKPPPLNQGKTGTCVAHGWTNFLRSEPLETVDGIDKPYDLYRKIVLVDEYPNNDSEATAADDALISGTSVRAGATVLTSEGRLAQYLWAFDLGTALNWILNTGPLVLGTNWYSGMHNPDSEGFVHIAPVDSVSGGHCYIWLWADTGRSVATLQNSWGDWGKGGTFYMDLKDVERLIKENGEACTAVEKSLVGDPK